MYMNVIIDTLCGFSNYIVTSFTGEFGTADIVPIPHRHESSHIPYELDNFLLQTEDINTLRGFMIVQIS